jgi:toluene monooxygenase electron transfer component
MNAHTQVIRLAGSDTTFACGADDSVLRAAQRAGLGFPYECNVGSCGNCKFELVEGELDTAWAEAPGWTDKDRQRKRHLGCQSRPLSDCVIKLRLNERYAPLHRPQRVQAVLAGRSAITHDISEFRFALVDAQTFEPGQYALVSLPGVASPRAYSMSNTALDDGGRTWHFQVRQVPGGAGSAALFGLQAGAQVDIDGPYGMAWLRRDSPRDILCLAGGSGLAPMISIVRGAVAEQRLAGRRLHFLYGGRTAADLCGQEMLSRLPGFGERLSWQGFVSTPSEGGAHEVAFVHEAAQRLHGPQLKDMEIYFAGPPLMATAVQGMLLQAGVPPEQQHFDQFY